MEIMPVFIQQWHQPTIDLELQLLVVEVRHLPDMTLTDSQLFSQTSIFFLGD
jgi:hypothetical protein